MFVAPKDAKQIFGFVLLFTLCIYLTQNLYVISSTLISLRVENVISSQPNNDRGMQTVLKSFHIVNGLVHSGLSPDPTIENSVDRIF